MEIIKQEAEGTEGVERGIVFRKPDKMLTIHFSGNLDLYFTFCSTNTKTFEITKENYYIYECFSKLYNNIKNNNLFEVDSFDLIDAKTIKDIEYIYEDKRRLSELAKTSSHYDELMHNDVITWKSDDRDGVIKDAGTVSIKKREDKFVLNFSRKMTSVRFKNSHSYYDPYNILFMDMFNNLMKYDENDKQIHMEEYLYNEKIRTRKR